MHESIRVKIDGKSPLFAVLVERLSV